MPWLRDYPHLLAELHPTKNLGRGIAPFLLRAGSPRKLWWLCPAAPDHEWETTVANRALQGRRCPFCANHKVSVTNSLATQRPDVARLWHPTKNGSLTPRDVVSGSYRKVWWKCPKASDHVWRSAVARRVRAVKSCPFCAGRYASKKVCLLAVRPDIAKEWHPTKNGALTPADVRPASDRKVWWKCRASPDHDWVTAVCNRTKRLATGCPYCAGRMILPGASLAARFPHIAAEWHPTKNGALTPREVAPHAKHRFWWKCPRGPDHEWEGSVDPRTRGATTGCPFCANKRLSVTNSLAARFPKIAREWHPTKNGRLTPRDVVAGTTRRVWWRCAFGHEWNGQINWRTVRGTGCGQCIHARRRARVATRAKAKRYVHLASYEGAPKKKR